MPASARRFALAASVCFLLAACGGGGGSNDNPNPNPGAPPAAPTALVATPGSAQVTLTWATVTGATSYNLYFGTSAGVTKTSGTKIQGVTSGYVHAGRTNNTTYHYVVTAVNAGGESAVSSEASATPAVNPAPAAPTNVAAAPANAQVTVSWDPVAGATSYTVYEGGPTVSKSAHAAVVTSATSPVVRSGLANGTAYYYVVTASNLNGESTDSRAGERYALPCARRPGGRGRRGRRRTGHPHLDCGGRRDLLQCVPGDVDRGHEVERHEVRGRVERRRPDRPHERHDLLLRRDRGERGR